MPRPLTAIIDTGAMRHNLEVARACAPHARAWAVVKANAYGHGLDAALPAFAGADGLALIEVDAAVRLRELGWNKPILLLEGFFHEADVALLAAHGIETAVHCDEQIAMLERADPAAPLAVHLKMNTGMNRLGFAPERFAAAHARLAALPAVRSIALMTHFANADEARHAHLPLAEQMRRFEHGAQGLPGQVSLANSAATLLHGGAGGTQRRADWIRPGIMLYGGTPGGGSAAGFGLRGAMTLASEIIGVQDLGPGEAVGYGSRFIADRRTRVGVVACGYADGYPRHAPDGTPVLVGGVRTRLLGRVSMDMIMVDLAPAPDAGVGTPVTLWGGGLPIDEVANAAGTIGYELMCAIAPRVARRII